MIVPDGVYNCDYLKIVNLMVVMSGGDKPIERRKLSWTSKAKIGSLEKANHRPGGGQVHKFLYIFLFRYLYFCRCINFCIYFFRCIFFCIYFSGVYFLHIFLKVQIFL